MRAMKLPRRDRHTTRDVLQNTHEETANNQININYRRNLEISKVRNRALQTGKKANPRLTQFPNHLIRKGEKEALPPKKSHTFFI